MIAVLQAAKDGKEIEWRAFNGEWRPKEVCPFDFNNVEYRVKPEPRRFWCVIKDGIVCNLYRDEVDAKSYHDQSVIFEFVEVIK
jgi:hypothetical protein